MAGALRRRGGPRVYVFALVGLLALCALFVASGTAVIQACATQDTLSGSDFEIDKIVPPPSGAKKNELPTGGANLKLNGSGTCIDWGSVSDSKQPDGTTGSNDNAFGQGTSENDAVPTVVTDSIPPNKSDLLNFGVYEERAATKTFVALYWARINSPSGTTNMDFELNQNSCDSSKPPATTPPGNVCSANGITPARLSGDKLVIFNLSSGGTVVDILLRTWDGSAWVGETQLNTSGKAIGSINYDALGTTADNDGLGVLSPLTFGEVVVDFQALLGSNQTCGSFGSVYLKSRSSDSFNAEMKDFIAPKPVTLTNCTAISTSATASVPVGSSISDTATLTNASSPTGNAVFKLYSDATCQTLVTTINGSAWSGGNGTFTSTATYATPAVGTYYWIASYAGDANNSSATGTCGDSGETSEVTKRNPTLGTTPSPSTGTVGVTALNDSATLSGAYNPTGSIVFSLWDPDQTCGTGTPTFTVTVPLTGNTATTTTGPTATKAGTWRWTASYAGDANNNAASSGCEAELVTIAKQSPTLSTTPSPTSGVVGVAVLNDSATLTGGANPTGSIVFSLWDPDQTCGTGQPVFTATVPLTGNTATTTTGPTANKVGTWRWTATYAGDANNDAASSGCEAELVTIDKAPSTITTTQSYLPNDTATIGGGGGGTVDFKLYGPFTDAQLPTAQCTGTPVVTVNGAAVSSGTASTNNTTQSISASGWYLWLVVYSGDPTHEGATSACGDERFKLTVDNNALP